MTRTGELSLLVNLAPAHTDFLWLIKTLHLHGATKMRARCRNAMKRVLLAKDEDALVVDELRAFTELVHGSNLEPLRIFVEHVRHQRTKERIGLTADRK